MKQRANVTRIDSILQPWQKTLGADYQGYRNHVVRMATFCLMLEPSSDVQQQKIEIAACFHDIGIWAANTMDYLEPSVPPARAWLAENGLSEWGEELAAMIVEHHRLRPVAVSHGPLVELFRKGDLVDFSRGLFRFGLPRAAVAEVMGEFPNAGFHGMLVRRLAGWLVRHPLNPAPMIRW